ncbi:MAG: membrane protein insertase YidC [Gammaproteobacteria bacterium]|nr:membrane protein insertase YidC [Gammaproteobacteria bacterium]
MDNLRLILVFSLAFIGLMLYQAWNQDYGSKPVAATSEQVTADSSIPASAMPVPVTDSSVPAVNPTVATVAPQAAVALASGGKIDVETDLFTIQIDTRGGTITQLLLNDYPLSVDTPDTKFELMGSRGAELYAAQSGLIGGNQAEAATHEADFGSEKNSYQMADDQDELVVDLVWQGAGGVKVIKRYRFIRGSYVVTLEQIVENGSGQPYTVNEYRQLMRTPPKDDGGNKFIYTFTGGGIYSPDEKFEKIAFDDMDDEKLSRQVKGGWVSMLQHYFVTAWVPPKDQVENLYTNVLPGSRYILGAYSPAVTLAEGDSHTFSSHFFAGPKLQDQLEALAPGLELTVDYGWLTILAKPIFWLLTNIHALIGNWGWSIILLTMMIKAVFYKLSETSYKSMANMRRMTPKIQSLKERYGDDKTRMNQAMMELYKKEKINPLGGCLPIVVQIPVFIALYWVLLESVEMRQAPFILWIQDLSIKDPYFVLPLVMGISMFIQQKINPAPPDPMQAKIMMSLPFVFTIFFAFFPAGLVLYWVVNNILSISQQYYITRKIEAAAAERKS